MKKNFILLLIAFFFFFLSIFKIIHWNLFWSNNEEVRKKDYFKFIEMYRDEVAKYIPQYKRFPHMLEVLSIIILCIAGIIFLRQKHITFKFLAVVAFILAFWNLFSLM